MSSNQQATEGLRFNQNKTRYDLIPPYAMEEFAKVLTLGAQKYAERNWEKGMAWSKVTSSLERHLYAIKRGEDYDQETGLLHSAHIMCNAAFLTEYYKIYPQGDDRPVDFLKAKRVGIDIDDVLAGFIAGYCERHKIESPQFWEFDRYFSERYEDIQKDESFWLNLKPILKPTDLPFEPVVYITARPESVKTATEKWLFEIHGYPIAPVVYTSDKLQAIKDHNVDAFIDDKLSTFVHLTKNGVLCYLFDAVHNRYAQVGHKRITKDDIKRIICR